MKKIFFFLICMKVGLKFNARGCRYAKSTFPLPMASSSSFLFFSLFFIFFFLFPFPVFPLPLPPPLPPFFLPLFCLKIVFLVFSVVVTMPKRYVMKKKTFVMAFLCFYVKYSFFFSSFLARIKKNFPFFFPL